MGKPLRWMEILPSVIFNSYYWNSVYALSPLEEIEEQAYLFTAKLLKISSHPEDNDYALAKYLLFGMPDGHLKLTQMFLKAKDSPLSE